MAKRISVWNKEYWIKRGLSEKDAYNKIREIQIKNNKNRKNNTKPYEKLKQKLILENKSKEEIEILITKIRKESSCWCKEYWIKRGFTEEESINKIKEKQTKNSLKVDNKNKDNPYEIKTWMNRGLSEKDSRKKIQQIKDSQNIYKNFSEDELNDVMQKRKDTYYSKSEKERNKINKNRGKTKEQLISKFGEEYVTKLLFNRGKGRRNSFFRRYSKISEKFFNDLQNNINNRLYFGKNEKWIRYNKNKGFYVDLLCKNKIIEFNGNFYHANPKFYTADSVIKISNAKILTAEQIWKKDKFKNKMLQSLNYKILIIWEDDLSKEEYNKTLIKCIKFLQDE